MILLRERIGKLADDIQRLIYKKDYPVQTYRIFRGEERFSDVAHLDTTGWELFDREEVWGGHREYFWFDTTVEIPADFAGECVVFELLTGKEGNWDANNPQFTVYVDGVLRQGFDVNHREVVLTECAQAGETHRIVLSAFTGDRNFSLKLDSKLKVLDRRTEKYYYDIIVPLNVARLLRTEDTSYITIITSLNESLNLLDLRKVYSAAYYESLEKAQDYLTKEFYEKHCGSEGPTVYCVGHTHIDCAWLWTLAVTEDKAVRSFSTVLELMREYPEYIFMSSQPQLYKYVKKHAPEVYEEIKERVQEGRWETDGGMWVEADCNLSSGESLIRQFMHGKRFFRDEFGKENYMLWLPDVFGYSAALPQIMKKCNLPYFMTTKISWNEFNKMPYDTFMWEGIDGTKVLTHFVPTRDYEVKLSEGGFSTSHFTTYNGDICPSQVKGGWERYSQKHLNGEVMNSFGWGDGGGGPTRKMLENQRRLAEGIPGCPKTVMSTAKHFFDVLKDHVEDNKYLPTWVGELYLEYHRGTYTSMARNKKYNRRSEFAYQNLETYNCMNMLWNKGTYPQTDLYEAWEVILRNQFHDILPGSSIKEVYDDSKAEYETILNKNQEMTADVLKQTAAQIDAPAGSLVVFHPNSVNGLDTVEFTADSDLANPVVKDGDKLLPVQKTENGTLLFRTENLPSKGYKTFAVVDGDAITAPSGLQATAQYMENDLLRVEFNEKGQFSRIYDKKSEREVLKAGECGNVIMTYEDRPHNFDAWDVNNYYIEKSWEVSDLSSIEVVENGPVRVCVKLTRHYLDSVICQYIYLYADSARLDIKNVIDWKEEHIFMKALFPVDVHTSEAVFDIQYGNVKRPTHYNTSWDFAKFEVCVHKWLDVAEEGYGVAVLNDCKYGCNVHDGMVGISMLKCATHPNPDADKEMHEFTYSILPHTGDFREAGIVAESYKLNNPVLTVWKQTEGGTLPALNSLVTSDSDNVVIEVVKKAEDSDDCIVRVYECYNKRTDAVLTFSDTVAAASVCNLMEEEDEPAAYEGKNIRIRIKPYEIMTFKVKLS